MRELVVCSGGTKLCDAVMTLMGFDRQLSLTSNLLVPPGSTAIPSVLGTLVGLKYVVARSL